MLATGTDLDSEMSTTVMNPNVNGNFRVPEQLAAEISPQNITNKNAVKQVTEDPFAPTQVNRENVNGVCSPNMSRGERPEADINWPKLENLYVYDEMGNKIKFSDIYRRQKTLVIFVRVSSNPAIFILKLQNQEKKKSFLSDLFFKLRPLFQMK